MEHAGEPAWAAALEASALGVLMRESTWLYPTANVLHVLAVAVLVGAALALDLRLLGVGRRLVPAEGAVRLLAPLAAGALALALPMGVLLFAADAGPLAGNVMLQAKLVLVAAGIANALLFQALWRRRLGTWDADAPAPARLQAAASAGGWIAAAACGRLIAYL